MKHFIKFPGGKSKALTMSYDDGVETDGRLIKIMQEHGLKGAFNINSESYVPEGTVYPKGQAQRIMSESAVRNTYTGCGMEIACHSCTHPYLEKIPLARCTYEIIKDRDNLEKMFSCIVRGLALPFGTYNDDVLESARACGIAYCRAAGASHSFGIPDDPLRWVPTCHHNDPDLFRLLERFLQPHGPDNFAEIFYLWGHSYEFDGNNNWERIEEFAEKAGGHEHVWYATNIEIIDYVNAVRSLIFSADGFIVHNPTCTDVWFYLNGNGTDGIEGMYHIPAGATVHLK